jgi:hypothetical protein
MTSLEKTISDLLVDVARLRGDSKSSRVKIRKLLVQASKDFKVWRSASVKGEKEQDALDSTEE